MPKRRRHQPGKYKPKVENNDFRMFNGPKPLTLFQAENGLWGVKDGKGNIEIEPLYQRVLTKDKNIVRLVSPSTVIEVTPDDWDIVSWIDEELLYGDE